MKRIFNAAWENVLSIPVTKFIQIVEDNFTKISDETVKISKDFETFIKKRGRPLTLTECKTRSDYDEYVRHANREIFGPHIENEASLYSFVNSWILNSHCCEPHRSKVKKKIVIEHYHEQPDYVKWKESTEFNIHHVLFPYTPISGQFFLHYQATAYAPKLNVESWASQISLIIRIDKETFLKNTDVPEFGKKTEPDIEGFFCWKEGNWINLRYAKDLPLTKEWTFVQIEEETINARDDMTYSLNTEKPTCGHSLDFKLPDGYKFIGDPFISSRVHYNGLPKFARTEIDESQYFDIRPESDNHIFIDINTWILPGIILNLNWIPK